MKKSILATILILLAIAVGAHTPTVTLDPVPDMEFATFPQMYDVTGTVVHNNPGNGNPQLSSVKNLTLLVNGVEHYQLPDPFSGGGDGSFSLPWTITGPGAYDVTVTARHGDDTGNATEEVVVTQSVVVVECPAAPSVAAHLLKDAGVKPGSKVYKNYVSQVAQHMGPQTAFDGVAACDVGYADAVAAFLQTL